MEAMRFSPSEMEELAGHFGALTAKVPLRTILNYGQYDDAVRAMDALLDAGAANEAHPLAHLVSALGELIRTYDEAHFLLGDASPALVLRELMEQHGVRQSDLPEIGSQGVVSEVLNGKREMNVRQIDGVSKRFGVSPAVFFRS
jgi:HTH-type transcriptional regulator/antitoxin HigA